MNTNFIDQTTVIVAAWLNDINNTVYNLLGNGTVVPANIATLRSNIGLGSMATQNSNAVAITGGTISGITIAGVAASGANSDITSLNGLTSAIYATGQCRLSLSGANLLLLPYGGNSLIVNGRSCTVPDAGVSLAPPATASTTFFIYAVATAGVITSLEASTTGHSTDTTSGNKGVEIKTGDSTRSLVGIARTSASNTWVDTSTNRLVRSWFNRSPTAMLNAFTTTRTSTSTTVTEVNSEIRCNWVQWADDVPIGTIQGGAFNTVATNPTLVTVGWDGVADGNSFTVISPPASSITSCSMSISKAGLTEGFHYATVMSSRSSADTTTFSTGFAGVFDSLSIRI